MEKKLGLFIILILIFSTGYSQSKKKKRSKEEKKTYLSTALSLKLKLYEETVSGPNSNGGEFNNVSKIGDLTNFGVGIERRLLNGLYYEIVLTRINLKRINSLVSQTSANSNEPIITAGRDAFLIEVGSRFEYGKYIWTSKNKNLKFGLGIGVELYINRSKSIPATSASFPVREHDIGAIFQLIPRITNRITESIDLEVKIIPNIFHLYHHRIKVDNPILPDRQRIQNSMENRGALDELLVSLGVKYRIK